MKIYEQVINKDNFDKFEDFENLNLSMKNNNGGIYITFKNSLPANLFVYHFEDGDYAYSFCEESLADYVRSRNVALNVTKEWREYTLTKDERYFTLTNNKYEEIDKFGLYKWLFITPYFYDFENIPKENLFSVPIENSADIVKGWIDKYKSIISDNAPNVTVELTGSVDSRALTSLWRDCADAVKVYLPNVPSLIEETILERFGKNVSLSYKKEGVVVSTVGIGVASNPCLFYDPMYFIFVTGQLNGKEIIEGICPYLDIDFVRIRPTSGKQIKTVLQLLLARDLMGIPYTGFNKPPYIFDDEYVNDAKRIIKEWGYEIE